MPSPTLLSPASELRSDLFHRRELDESDLDYETPPLVIPVLASLLQRTVSKNSNTAQPRSPFHSQSPLDLSLHSFLGRIFRYTHPSPSIFVVAYVYLDRLRPSLPLSPSNSQRLLLTTVMLASKFLQDVNFKNSYYARIGGVTTEEMNTMELESLRRMGFRLHVNVRVFESYCEHLEREVSMGGGYQIERVLVRCMCSLHDSNSTTDGRRRRRRLEQLANLIL